MEWIFPLIVILVPIIIYATEDYDHERWVQIMRELNEIKKNNINN